MKSCPLTCLHFFSLSNFRCLWLFSLTVLIVKLLVPSCFPGPITFCFLLPFPSSLKSIYEGNFGCGYLKERRASGLVFCENTTSLYRALFVSSWVLCILFATLFFLTCQSGLLLLKPLGPKNGMVEHASFLFYAWFKKCALLYFFIAFQNYQLSLLGNFTNF